MHQWQVDQADIFQINRQKIEEVIKTRGHESIIHEASELRRIYLQS